MVEGPIWGRFPSRAINPDLDILPEKFYTFINIHH